MQSPEKQTIASQQIRFTTYFSIVVNIAMFVLKLAVGWLSGSMALVADGVHSLSDMATDVAVLLGHRLGSKAPDQKHPYGHGRLETFSAVFIAIVLIVVGGGMIYAAAMDMASDRHVVPHRLVLVIALISVLAKEGLYHLTLRAAKQSNSSALYANAWHHRSDALSSVAVLLGYGALVLGYRHGDQWAAVVVGGMVLLVGVRVLSNCLNELAESAVDQDTMHLVEEIINSDAAIHGWHKLRSRSVGREIFLDLHILVDPALNVSKAHDITENLEATIVDRLSCPVNITIHVEPDLPELRL